MIKYIYLLSLFLCFTSGSSYASEYDKNIAELENYIGGYPPRIDSNETKVRIVHLYERTIKSLNQQLLISPNSETLLFQRGTVQSMGHNMDYHNAWKGADSDLRALLTINPNHIEGVLVLGTMYVNTGPEFSERAMNLFLAAQCLSGDQPNEAAQRGLFFAYYYQGKILEAYNQTKILNKYWPENSLYSQLDKMIRDRFPKVISSENSQKATAVAFTSCQKGKNT